MFIQVFDPSSPNMAQEKTGLSFPKPSMPEVIIFSLFHLNQYSYNASNIALDFNIQPEFHLDIYVCLLAWYAFNFSWQSGVLTTLSYPVIRVSFNVGHFHSQSHAAIITLLIVIPFNMTQRAPL